MPAACPAESDILDLVEGRLTAIASNDVRNHVDACAECRELVVNLAEQLLPPSSDVADARLEHCLRGTTIGRYTLLDRVGVGGMGAVYAAYDPELDRKVAVKLLRTDLLARGDAAELRARMVHEAQAMARLNHPHVIAVYDVGTFGDELFIAMEFVEGTTLRAWARERPRGWRALLDRYLRAGEGLAAAHRAGLVHRDFKPDNVLVGDDGRVRVSDFGVARTGTSPVDATLVVAAAAHECLRTVALVGTPAYMAPEQREGLSVDERADQFSFCRALAEALFEDGDTGAPTWLRAPLERGQHADRRERWPTMDELLLALRRDPARSRRRWLAGVGVAALVGLAAFGLARPVPDAAPACADAEQALAGVWDDEVRARVMAARFSLDAPWVVQMRERADATLTGHARRWQEMYTEACVATHVRGEQSPELFDLRMQCLDRRRDELAALTELLAQPQPARVDRALRAVDALLPLDDCADAEALRAAVRLPADAHARALIEQRSAELDRSIVSYQLGNARDVLGPAQRLSDASRELGYPPLELRALQLLGNLHSALGEPAPAEAALLASLDAAARSRDERRVANVLVDLVRVVGVEARRHAEALTLARVADAALTHGRNPDPDRAELHSYLGMIATQQERLDDAGAEYERALSLLEQQPSVDPLRAAVVGNLALVLRAKGDRAAAKVQLERALAMAEAIYGPDHPMVASASLNLGVDLDELGEHADARRLYERAIAIFESVYGPVHPDLASCLVNLSIAERADGRLVDAQRHAQRAADILLATFGDHDPRYGRALLSLGETSRARGQRAVAAQQLADALAVFERALGPDHPDVTEVRATLTELRVAQGRAASR